MTRLLRHTSAMVAMPIALALFACATPTTRPYVGYGDTGERDTLEVDVTGTDLKELAMIVTDKFLRSKLVTSWGSQRPRLIVGRLVNNTDDENIRMSDLYDLIQNDILSSGLVRVVDSTATSFDYILKNQLTSTRQYGKDNAQIYHFTLQMKLFKLDGELMGQWSHDVKKVQGRKRMF